MKREKARLGCYSSVAMTFLKREESVKRSFRICQNYTTLCCRQDIIVPVQPLANGFYIRHPKTPSPSLSLVKVDNNNNEDFICAKEKDVFPNGILHILWCESTPSRILLHANNATWVEFAFKADKPHLHATFSEWDDMIVSRIFNEFSSCENCSLITTISKSLRDSKWLECVFIELRKTPARKVYRYEVVKEFLFELSKRDHLFRVNKIHLYSIVQCDGRGCDGRDCGEPLCKEHFVLLQVGHRIMQYQIRRLEASGKCTYELSDPVNTMCATYHPGSASVRIYGSFTLSRDKKLVGLLTNCDDCDVSLHIWNLESGMYQKRELELNPLSTKKLEFFAVGGLYSVLEMLVYDGPRLKKELIVLRTDSGKIIVRERMASVVFCGCNEEWMSSLATLEEPRLFKFVLLDQSEPIEHFEFISI